ncbi:MAG: hypothetical protein UW41_C0005G0040 [Candidatus Collierbacteria bacterium GW2011_GWC2_44_18]|uniref:Uncharacterized protein n=2 Tax=Microgenomates group TaxID=1794810 RepID=A0A0G1J935_9BACT|nr:MAG: hypothetical protein UW16_C0001G0012 [Microgenomates group bacterium GW2011_GWC1_44_10]KKT49537.1 MAG: hypothetical protein UW41_C0005G0040 [Candidatus Collierbacteria bacterium GW2011_GWC2_44_18]KKT67775.1 MAG: hypothetical protein UW60_C0001G0053 [Candidatus Woesebacteria bacterium GW2011_GWA2_44_33]
MILRICKNDKDTRLSHFRHRERSVALPAGRQGSRTILDCFGSSTNRAMTVRLKPNCDTRNLATSKPIVHYRHCEECTHDAAIQVRDINILKPTSGFNLTI